VLDEPLAHGEANYRDSLNFSYLKYLEPEYFRFQILGLFHIHNETWEDGTISSLSYACRLKVIVHSICSASVLCL
jgi:hypothetical protein